MPLPLDHIVINTLTGMDAAAEVFSALGFALTPRGYHTLGSLNHLMMAPGAYLELVGVPPTGRQRADVLNSPPGLNGLVLRSDDADATAQALAAAGLEPQAPVAFSRPVEIGGETRDARFRTVRLPGARFPAGRVYFCQHLTPELVWRDEWLTHPNGFCGFSDIVVDSPDPGEDAVLYAAAVDGAAEAGAGGAWRIPLDGFEILIRPAAESRFASLGLVFDGAEEIARRAEGFPGAEWHPDGPGRGRLSLPALGLHIDCRSRA